MPSTAVGKRSASRKQGAKVAASRQKTPAAGFSLAPGDGIGGILVRALVIVLASFGVFYPALQGDWLWDDSIYFSQNPLLNDPHRLWKAWFEPGSFIEYYPLQETVQWVQWQLWHEDTFGYHLTNVLLHIVNALLVWRLLGKLGLRLAWLGGLIFAVHPTAVESVASIAELKNTLSLAPFLLATGAWIDYVESNRRVYYGWALGLFLAAMLCKITMAPFPAVMLLYAWWKRGRIALRDVVDSLPFWAIAVALAVTSSWAGQHYAAQQNALPDVERLHGMVERIDCAGLALAFYFSRCFLPVDPVTMYPQWPLDPHALWQFLPWPVLAGVIAWLWCKRAGWGRPGLLGLGWFVLFLLPFLGFTTISYMKFSWVMDHFLYIPIIGVIGLFVAAVEEINRRIPAGSPVRFGAAGGLAVVLGALAWESNGYAGAFQSEETLFTHVLRYNPGAWAAHENYGFALAQKNRLADALEQLEEAVRLEPGDVQSHINLGLALDRMGNSAGAQTQYEEALKRFPASIDARLDLVNNLEQAGRLQDALAQLKQAAADHPDVAKIRLLMGDTYFRLGQHPQALEQYAKAAELDPNSALAHYNCGALLRLDNRLAEAITQFKEATRLNPGDADSWSSLGEAYSVSGSVPDAIRSYQQALAIQPNSTATQKRLAQLLQQQNGAATGP
jgi:tetratricopeptide (TPR) repeat protein